MTAPETQQSKRPTALITGASAGIGYELAKQFAKNGYDLVLIARREDVLKNLSKELSSKFNITAHVFAADLADSSAPQAIETFTKGSGIHVDVLVNNAGFGARGYFAKLDISTHMDMLQVNVNALVALTRLYLPGMLEAKSGGVMNLASTAAFVPGPLMAVYYASKAFVLSFSEALANEAQGTGVKVSCVCPGATATEFQERANMTDTALFKGPNVMTAAEVARQAFDGFNAGEAVVITGALNQIAAFSSRLVPRRAAAQMVRRFQELH